MIFVDSNVPMYIVGGAHPNKGQAQRLLELCVSRGERLVTDAETLQEVLHRYTAIRRHDAIQPAIDVMLGAVDDVFPVELIDVVRAKDLLFGATKLSARDALHVAIMARHDVSRLLSFDAGFDAVEWIERIAT